MLTILFILLVLALVGGGIGHSRYGYAGWSPAGILVVILLSTLISRGRARSAPLAAAPEELSASRAR
ncbi:MAG: hypothetical protein K0R38_65 [Polyangiaceae bacterium]|nr:hypothetical protein [Polyangiaceae bacterium]